MTSPRSLILSSSLLCLLRCSVSLPPSRRNEPLPHRLDHLRKPVEIQQAQRRIANQINANQPKRQLAESAVSRHAGRERGRVPAAFTLEHGRCQRARGGGGQRRIDVRVDEDGLVCAPHDAAAEEGHEQGDAVVELGLGAGKIQLVAEPMDVQEGGGELVEDEGEAVVVSEGPLDGDAG